MVLSFSEKLSVHRGASFLFVNGFCIHGQYTYRYICTMYIILVYTGLLVPTGMYKQGAHWYKVAATQYEVQGTRYGAPCTVHGRPEGGVL